MSFVTFVPISRLLRNLLPLAVCRFVLAVDEAVSSVFVASFKMAVFYLLWTWLVHSLFAVKFVYLPSGG